MAHSWVPPKKHALKSATLGGKMCRASDPLVVAKVVLALEVLEELLVGAAAEGLAPDAERHKGWEEDLENDDVRVLAEAVHLRARGARDAVLEEEPDYGKHRQAAICDLSVQASLPFCWVLDAPEQATGAEEAKTEVGRVVGVLLDERKGTGLDRASEEKDLGPAYRGHLRERGEAA